MTTFSPATLAIARGRDWTLDALWLLIVGGVSSAWCLTVASQLGATFDEPFYLAQGLEYWRTGSHARLMSKGTMPLAVDLTTLPLYVWERWAGVRFDLAGDFDRVLLVARAGTLVFWWVLLGYGWLAGRLLGGPWGGRLAVALLAAEPSLLGHASLATTDVAVTACMVALVYHFAVGREAGWLRRLAIPTVWYAAAVLAKASGLVFGPLCLLAVEIERLARAGAFRSGIAARSPRERLRHGWRQLEPFRRDIVRIVGLGLVLVFVYCGSDWSVEPSFVAWAQSLPDGPTGQTMRWVAEHLRIFTNAGQGLVKQIQHNIRGHGVFLLGEVRPRAIWYYFPVALSIKMTLAALLLPLVVAAIRPRALRNWAVVAALVLLLFSLTSRVQIGVRMLLPHGGPGPRGGGRGGRGGVPRARSGLAATPPRLGRRCGSRLGGVRVRPRLAPRPLLRQRTVGWHRKRVSSPERLELRLGPGASGAGAVATIPRGPARGCVVLRDRSRSEAIAASRIASARLAPHRRARGSGGASPGPLPGGEHDPALRSVPVGGAAAPARVSSRARSGGTHDDLSDL